MVDYKEDAFQRIVNVHWRKGARYFLMWSAASSQSWDGGFSPVSGLIYDIISASVPFDAMDVVHYNSAFSPGPVPQQTHPSDFPGIVSAQTSGITAYQHSITNAALRNDDLTHWNWEQYDSRDTTGPFVWVAINDGAFNVNLMSVGDTAHFTIEGTGTEGDTTFTFFMVKLAHNNLENQDLGLPGFFNMPIGPSANLVNIAPGTFELALTRVTNDIWLFAGDEGTETTPGFVFDNTPFPP